MSKPKSKPKRVEYVTAAAHARILTERDVLDEALTDIEGEVEVAREQIEELKAERNSLAMTFDAKQKALEETEHRLAATTKDRDRWISEFNMYRSAWLREIGGVIRSKTHEIDGFVLRTRDIFERSKRTESAEENYRTMCEYRDQWATQSAVWEEKAKELEFESAMVLVDRVVERSKNDLMLDAVCKVLETTQQTLSSWQKGYNVLMADYWRTRSELDRAKRNVFSKLWHWFWGESKPKFAVPMGDV